METEVRHDTVLDTGAEHLGRIYAEALLAAAEKGSVCDLVVQQLQELVDECLANHPQLAAALQSPRVDVKEKAKVIDRLFASQVDPTLLRFLKIVAQRGRLGFLRPIASAARSLRDEQLGRASVEVRSAVPLTDELRSSIGSRLGQFLGREVVLREKVDPSVIGGLVIRVGDTVYDSSVAGRLSSMAKKTQLAFSKKMMEQADRFGTAPTAN